MPKRNNRGTTSYSKPTRGKPLAVGSVFNSIHMRRPMKVFPVHQSEITSLSFLNNLVTGFFSAAFSLFFLGVGIVIDLAVEGKFGGVGLSESDRVLLYCVAPLVGGLAILSIGAGIWATVKRKSTWAQIEGECTEV